MAESSAKERSRPWTETELKYFALVLADETNEFAYKLDTLALKKTANKPVFEDIKKAFEERISYENVSLPFLPLTYIGDLKTLVLPFSYGKKI